MSQLNIEEILSYKILQKQLANFYLVENIDDPNIYNRQLGSHTWANIFFKNLNQNINFEMANHPDLLIINNPSNDNYDAKNISVEQLEELNSFLNHKPIKWQNKFVLIFSASAPSEIIQNKLLKSLEEPLNNTVFMIFTDIASSFLSTVISRSLKIKIKPSLYAKEKIDLFINHNEKNFEEIINDAKNLNANDFLENYKQHEIVVTRCAMNKVAHLEDSLKIQDSISLFKWLEDSKKMNNSNQERLFQLYQILNT